MRKIWDTAGYKRVSHAFEGMYVRIGNRGWRYCLVELNAIQFVRGVCGTIQDKKKSLSSTSE